MGLAADGWHKLILMQKLVDSRLDSRYSISLSAYKVTLVYCVVVFLPATP